MFRHVCGEGRRPIRPWHSLCSLNCHLFRFKWTFLYPQRTKIVATRHFPVPQNIPKMFCDRFPPLMSTPSYQTHSFFLPHSPFPFFPASNIFPPLLMPRTWHLKACYCYLQLLMMDVVSAGKAANSPFLYRMFRHVCGEGRRPIRPWHSLCSLNCHLFRFKWTFLYPQRTKIVATRHFSCASKYTKNVLRPISALDVDT